ncbi:MAG TPA: AEC family transporter [Synergistaceae bacterium]|nr:AEC family transporter [Synergistaceae bacterium]HPJ25839.1 AEC family transporter [Synergistaceae bacterium]
MQVLRVFLFNIFPLFAIVGAGMLLARLYKPDLQTLSKLVFYFLLPPFVFVILYERSISLESGKVFFFGCLLTGIMWGVASLFGRIRKYPRELRATFASTVMFSNAGNMGIPLVMLVFSSPPFMVGENAPWVDTALTVHMMVWLVQTLGLNTLGFAIAGNARLPWKAGLFRVFQMPVIYAIFLVFLAKSLPLDLTAFPLWPALLSMRNAYVAVTLLTLGVQLYRTKWSLRNRPMYYASSFRLLLSPIIGFFLIILMDFSGIAAQVLLIYAALPSAVVTALIAVEYDLYPDFAASSVMCSTLLSAVTLPITVVLGQFFFPFTH